MILNGNEPIENLKEIGKIVAEIRNVLIESIEPGLTTKALDLKAKMLFEKYGAQSAPITDYDFPGYTCISVNEVVAHGIPGKLVINEGDIVNIDVSGCKYGFYADTGATKIAGQPKTARDVKLLEASHQALMAGIEKALIGNRVYHIGEGIYKIASENQFQVIRNLTGHGIGCALHEPPHQISNYYVPTEDERLKVGHVLAIETFLSTQAEWVDERLNGWELYTPKGNRTAQFEHTVIVTSNGPLIITDI